MSQVTTLMSSSDLLIGLPLIALFLMSILPILIKVLNKNIEPPPALNLGLGLVGLLLAAAALVVVGGTTKTGFHNMIVADGLSQWMGIIALASAAFSMILMHENLATNGRQYTELIFLTLSSVFGMLLLASAVDLLVVFIGLEAMSLALYIMIAMGHEQKLSKEAAFKYFVLGGMASALFLYGISFIYGTAGTTNILELMQKTPAMIQSNELFLFGIAFVVIGFCFKVSIAPFHAWTPDVYQGSPTPHTALMATAVKAVSFTAFLRIIFSKGLLGSESLFEVMQWFAVLTMIVGNVAAILQNNLKRMLAYSSIAHSGYILVGVITAGVAKNVEFGASGVVFYLVSYSLMTIGSFAMVSLFEKTENHSVNIDDMAGLARKQPLLALGFSILLLSLAGIPPSLGFFSKLYLFGAAINEGLLWLAIWGVINSVISVYYYLRPIVVMYMKEGDAEIAEHPLGLTTITMLLSSVLIALMGIISGPLFQAVEKSLGSGN